MIHTDSAISTKWWEQPYDEETSLKARINEVTKIHSSRNAVLNTHGKWLTYGDLHLRAIPVASRITQSARSNQGPVVCLVGLSVSVFVCLISVINASVDFTFLDPAAPEQRNLNATQSINGKRILVDQSTLSLGLSLASDPDQVINIDQPHPPNRPKQSNRANPTSSHYEPRMIIFTSGSTSQPKGVIRPLSSLLHTQYNKSVRLEFHPNDILLAMGSPSHIGCINNSLGVLLNGHAAICQPAAQFDPAIIWARILEHGVTIASIPPSLLKQFLQYISTRKERSSLRFVLTSGEAIDQNDLSILPCIRRHC